MMNSNKSNNGGGVVAASQPSSAEQQQSSGQYGHGYPKIAQDVPVDRYIQQLPSDGQSGMNDFFSLFLPSAEFVDSPSTPAQNPLKLQYNDPNLQAKLLKTQGSRKRRAAVKHEATAEEAELSKLPDDERAKQTRLLKNRQAAQQFRKRQKTHIIELENQVEALTSDNSVLVSRLEMLTAENKLIKEQLEYMRNFVMNCLQLSFPPNTSLQDLQRFGQLAGSSLFPPSIRSQPSDYQKPTIPPIGAALGSHHFLHQPPHLPHPNEMRAEARPDMRQSHPSHHDMRSELRSDMRSELRSELRSDMRSDLRPDLRSEMRSELRSAEGLRSDLRSSQQQMHSSHHQPPHSYHPMHHQDHFHPSQGL